MDLITQMHSELPEMPRKLAVSARYAIANPDRIALQSMRASALNAGVTSTTMLRLARYLGFASYDDFRASFQDRLVSHGFGARAGELQSSRQKSADRTPADLIFESARKNLENTGNALSGRTLMEAAEQIRKAREVYLIASGSAFQIAALFKTTGTMALPNLRLVGAEYATAAEGMAWLGRKDFVIGIGIAPYATRTIEGLAYAQAAGAGTLVITDGENSPLADLGDWCLFCDTQSPHYFPSAISLVAAIEALLATIVAYGPGEAVQQISRVETDRDLSSFYISRQTDAQDSGQE